MTTDHAASVQGVALRVTALDPTGAPLSGANTSFVTNAFISMTFTPEYLAGTEIQEQAADGTVCVYYQMPDILKRATLALSICAPDPELTQLLIGGSVLDDSASVPAPVGYSAPLSWAVPTPNGVALEVWSKAIVGGRPAAANPYWHWVFPYAQVVMDGDRVLENGAMANTFTGYSLGNSAFGSGPQTDWQYTTDSAFQYVRASTFPSGINGFQTVT